MAKGWIGDVRLRTIGHIQRMGDAAGSGGQIVQGSGAAGQRMHHQPFAAEPFDDGGANPGRSAGH